MRCSTVNAFFKTKIIPNLNISTRMTLSGSLLEPKNNGKVELGDPKGVRGRFREPFCYKG